MLRNMGPMRAQFGLLFTLALLLSTVSGLKSYNPAVVPRKLIDAGLAPEKPGDVTPLYEHRARELQALILGISLDLLGILDVNICAAIALDVDLKVSAGSLCVDLSTGPSSCFICTDGYQTPGTEVAKVASSSSSDCAQQGAKYGDSAHCVYTPPSGLLGGLLSSGSCSIRGNGNGNPTSNSGGSDCYRMDFAGILVGVEVLGLVRAVVAVGSLEECQIRCGGDCTCDAFNYHSDGNCHIMGRPSGGFTTTPNTGVKRSAKKIQFCRRQNNLAIELALIATVTAANRWECEHQCGLNDDCHVCSYNTQSSSNNCNLAKYGTGLKLAASVNLWLAFRGPNLVPAAIAAKTPNPPYGSLPPHCGTPVGLPSPALPGKCAGASTPGSLAVWLVAALQAPVVELKVHLGPLGICGLTLIDAKGNIQVLGRIDALVNLQVLSLKINLNVLIKAFTVYLDATTNILAGLKIVLNDGNSLECKGTQVVSLAALAALDLDASLFTSPLTGCMGYHGPISGGDGTPYCHSLGAMVSNK